MESDVVCFKSLPREQGAFRSLVSVGGGGYHLPAGSLVTLVSKQEKFRAETKCVHADHFYRAQQIDAYPF